MLKNLSLGYMIYLLYVDNLFFGVVMKYLLFFVFSLNIQAMVDRFVPSEHNCGAAITANPNNSFPDNIHAALACMEQGYRNIYLTDLEEFNQIDKNNLNNNISFYIIKGLNFPAVSSFSDKVILFTKQGQEYASILAKHQENIFNILKNNIPVFCLENLGEYCCSCFTLPIRLANHYLIMKYYYPKIEFFSCALTGILLGYKKEDIEYFYTRQNNNNFLIEYEQALKYIQDNKERAYEWMENKIKKNQ